MCVIIKRLRYSNVFSCGICISDVAMKNLELYWVNIYSYNNILIKTEFNSLSFMKSRERCYYCGPLALCHSSAMGSSSAMGMAPTLDSGHIGIVRCT